jgi:hypothetical protein
VPPIRASRRVSRLWLSFLEPSALSELFIVDLRHSSDTFAGLPQHAADDAELSVSKYSRRGKAMRIYVAIEDVVMVLLIPAQTLVAFQVTFAEHFLLYESLI